MRVDGDERHRNVLVSDCFVRRLASCRHFLVLSAMKKVGGRRRKHRKAYVHKTRQEEIGSVQRLSRAPNGSFFSKEQQAGRHVGRVTTPPHRRHSRKSRSFGASSTLARHFTYRKSFYSLIRMGLENPNRTMADDSSPCSSTGWVVHSLLPSVEHLATTSTPSTHTYKLHRKEPTL